MRPNEVIFFCSVYLLFFFIIGNLVGVASFPPPSQWVGFEIWGHSFGIHLSFWSMAAILAAIVVVVIATLAAGIKVFGSGVQFDQAFVVTIAIALYVGGLLAWTMTTMFIDVPVYVAAVLTWPFVGLLMYNIVITAKGGGG